MIGEYTLERLCQKYNIDSKKLVNNNNNILTYGEYIEMDKTLNYLCNELKIVSKNIEKCPSVLYRNVNAIRNNVEFLKQQQISFNEVEECLHGLSSKPEEVKKTYDYVLNNYDLHNLNKITSILSCPVDIIKEVESLNLNISKDGILSISGRLNLGFTTYDELNNVVKENIGGIRVVKSYVREDYEIKKFDKVSNKIYKLFTKAEKIVASNSALMDSAIYTTILLVSFIGAKSIVNGHLTTGQLASLFTYSMSILTSLMMVSMIYVMIIISLPSMKRVVELLDENPDIKDSDKAIDIIPNGSIEFKNVDFSYNNDKKKLALNNINIKINSGETIGIIGSTGSGKSTLVNLIPRLYDPTSGEVLVGGINVKDYSLYTLRNEVSMVLQKNVLFSGTIRDNLCWGDAKASDDEINKACDLACATEFISKFDNGLDYYIEQGATNVSGGQKQRLAIARALLKKPKIIIFDDSTSACDTMTDAKIRNNLKTFMPDVTKLIIAQRISSVEDADKVIVIDEGKIVDFDTPENLMKTSKIYKEINDSQKKGVSINE